jgi:hypothetical protein
MKHKEVGPLQHGERKERKEEEKKTFIARKRKERKKYETTRMNIELKKIESLQHKEETNARRRKNDSCFLLFKHLSFRKRR